MYEANFKLLQMKILNLSESSNLIRTQQCKSELGITLK